MTNDELIFDRYTQKYGGLLVIEGTYYAETKTIFADILENYKHNNTLLKSSPFINVDIIKNENFGAIAKLKDPNYAIIGINDATRPLLSDIFNRMLSYKNLFLDMGDPTKEVLESPTIRNFYTNTTTYAEFGSLDYSEYEFLQPKDQLRKLYADYLTNLSMIFIFEHELSHIFNGHLHFINNSFGLNYTHYYNKADENVVTLKILRAFEMDADCTAYNNCAAWAILYSNLQKNSGLDYPLNIFYSNIENAIVDLITAIYMSFRLLGDGRYKLIETSGDEHAPPRVRQLQIMATMEPNILAINKKAGLNISVEKIKKKMRERMKECEKAFNIMTGNPTNLEAFDARYYADNSMAIEMIEEWGFIRPKLLPFSYRELAP